MLRPNDRVIVQCPKGEDYKAIVLQCKPTRIKVAWVDNATWKRLDSRIYRPEWKSIHKVTLFQSNHSDDDEREDDDDEIDMKCYNRKRPQKNDSTAHQPPSKQSKEEPTLNDLKTGFEMMDGYSISFGCGPDGLLYRNNPKTFKQVFESHNEFESYAQLVTSGMKPPYDGVNKSIWAPKYIAYCALKHAYLKRLENAVKM